MIVRRSIHHQWIERLWRDVFQGALKFYYVLFYDLESMGIFDPNSDILSSAFITYQVEVWRYFNEINRH